ncbi:unnamed protein product [Cylindrotheca closterium]|uniref:Uncharacterized protein n=1 Tax=Cylindrotheca closterium TaxID=2856 RepID=A0AAD2JLB9_9STRA|nr:unnamed protein product [Cylindrotheca closterium]
MGNNSGQKRKQMRTDPPLTFMTVRSFAAMEQAQKLDFSVNEVYHFPKIHYAPIKIGGIKDSVNIKAIIEYYTPFANEDGENHTLMIGLMEQLPINTLFGFPFMLKAKMAPDFHRKTVTSSLFNQEFELTMERPTMLPVEHTNITPKNT